ncbi:MAG: MGMT family protein [Candidatus Eisenbacteria bacterium]|uniref:MGMT family protein n=1 Tax=Eiseniibacteriota bacterium TaxID=2212470 RepID=A0A948W7B0_UNCEI|nr:MGMT family protein [Candidatus Eisenbacteria bacterium]MBU1950843.1 MGMT family protein [Candidatus Eisenbacteria bacterium]MBU2692409.1 MGMT family protein [Candidatus Eisenbacteria bacterium]
MTSKRSYTSPQSNAESGLYERIYNVVRKIPKGKVTNYGHIAIIVGECTPRMVGYAMASVPFGSNVPWQRVVNSKGEVSARRGGDGAFHQREQLEAEGVVFDEAGRIDLKKFGWAGPGPRQRL